MIYLDNAATTKPCKEAVEAINYALTQLWSNPSAQYHFGIEAARLLRQARQTVAQAMGAETDKVFFTSGGTEADNWAIFSAAERLGKRGKHIITTKIEHPAVLQTCKALEKEGTAYEIYDKIMDKVNEEKKEKERLAAERAARIKANSENAGE